MELFDNKFIDLNAKSPTNAVYTPKFRSIHDKMAGTETLAVTLRGRENENDSFKFNYILKLLSNNKEI